MLIYICIASLWQSLDCKSCLRTGPPKRASSEARVFLESFDLSIGKYDDELIESVVALGGRGAFTYAVVLIFAARCQPHYHSARLLRRLVDVAHHVVGGRLLDLEDVSVENRVGIFERIGRQLAGRIEASFHRYIVLVNIRQQGRLADDSFPEQDVRRGDVLRLLVVSMQAAYFYDMPSGGLRVESGRILSTLRFSSVSYLV